MCAHGAVIHIGPFPVQRIALQHLAPERLFVAEKPIPPAKKRFAPGDDDILTPELQFCGDPGGSQHPDKLPAAAAWMREHEYCAESFVQVFDPKQKKPDQFRILGRPARHGPPGLGQYGLLRWHGHT